MNTIYRREYTFTGYTLATREFKLTSRGKKLPPELATNNLERVSKMLGFDFTKVYNAYIKLHDGTEIDFKHDPLDGDDHVIIQGREFVRNWYDRNEEEYIDPENPEFTYKNGKISIYVYPKYDIKHIPMYLVIPENFPITDWDDFIKDPHKHIAPHIPLDMIKETKVSKKGTLSVVVDPRVDVGKKFVTTVKKNNKYVIYKNVPFIEGLFDVKIPMNVEADIVNTMSIKKLPEEAELKERFFITDSPGWEPEYIYYDRGALEIMTRGITLHYTTSDGYEYIYYDRNTPKIMNYGITLYYIISDGYFTAEILHKPARIRIENDGYPILRRIIEASDPAEEIILLSNLL